MPSPRRSASARSSRAARSLQRHLSEGDEWTELAVCQALAAEIDGAELYVYPGSGHLFADPGSADYEPEHARLLGERTLEFLDRIS